MVESSLEVEEQVVMVLLVLLKMKGISEWEEEETCSRMVDP